MNEELQLYLDEAGDQMNKALTFLEHELLKLRAGKATPQMLDGILVDYYGTMTPLAQVANINTPDARTIAIQPWEKKLIDKIEKAIFAANIGITPINNGELIRLNLPALTEERRKGLVKQIHTEGELAKISIRNTRRETIEEIKKLQKNGLSEDLAKDAEEDVQKLTDQFHKKIEEAMVKREQEVMTI